MPSRWNGRSSTWLSRLRTSNLPERLGGGIRRRTRVAGLLPNEASALRPVGAVPMETGEDGATNRKHLTREPAWPARLQLRG